MRRLFLLIGLGVPTYAMAQTADDGAAQTSVIPWAEGHRWQRAGLSEAVSSMTVSLQGTVLALSQNGAVWRHGRGLSWRQVLDPPGARLTDPNEIDEEGLLLEAESVLSDQSDFSRMSQTEAKSRVRVEDEDGEEDVKGMPIIAPPTLSDDEVAGILIETAGVDERAGPQAGAVVWAATGNSGLVLCDRSDGMWRSDDDGLTWTRTWTENLPAVVRFHQMASRPMVVYAGTDRGLRVSVDAGRSWIIIHDPIADVPVRAFADDTKRLWAGTDEGLFTSPDGVRWAKLVPRRDADIPVWAVASDPYWERGLWLAGPVGILRSDDGGESLRPAGRNPLRGTAHLLPLTVPGHVLAAGRDGVWESLDGGIRWRPLAHGLIDPAVTGIVPGPESVMMSGPQGVFVLRRTSGEEEVFDKAAALEVHANVPPMGQLVDVALRRPGLAMTNVLSKRRLVASMLLPKLTLFSRWDRRRYISADHEARSNRGSRQVGWLMGVTACFGNCSSLTAFSELDIETAADTLGVEVSELAEMAEVTVVGDEVYIADTAGSLAPVAANVAERLTKYRSEVANRVSELAISRRRLVDARGELRSLSLKDRVAHELDIQEAAARIDVYTNGYFTGVLEGS
jgi:hypothetical protein